MSVALVFDNNIESTTDLIILSIAERRPIRASLFDVDIKTPEIMLGMEQLTLQ